VTVDAGESCRTARTTSGRPWFRRSAVHPQATAGSRPSVTPVDASLRSGRWQPARGPRALPACSRSTATIYADASKSGSFRRSFSLAARSLMDNSTERYWLYPKQQLRLVLKNRRGNGTHPMMRCKGTTGRPIMLEIRTDPSFLPRIKGAPVRCLDAHHASGRGRRLHLVCRAELQRARYPASRSRSARSAGRAAPRRGPPGHPIRLPAIR